MLDRPSGSEFVRFIANGLFAAAVHFAVLTFLLEVMHLEVAAAANFVAAIFGITASFLGNHYFVFTGRPGHLITQAWRFAGFYAVMLLVHTGLLFVWSDMLGFDYRIGFVLATATQILLSYFGNKLLVFT